MTLALERTAWASAPGLDATTTEVVRRLDGTRTLREVLAENGSGGGTSHLRTWSAPESCSRG